MVDKNTDFFKIADNFAKTANTPSIQIITSDLDFRPKVSIVVPTFKRAALLKETIDSAINQKGYENYDIIVVDNDPERGCETEQLMHSYSSKRISYYKNSENIGMSGNWNRLFELAAGDYVAMLHDDDLILPNFLKEGMEILDKNNTIDLLKPQFYLFYDDLSKVDVESLPSKSNKLIRISSFSFYQGCTIGAPTGMFFKKQAVLKIGGFNQDFYPSLDYCFLVLFAKYFNVYLYDKYLALYRIGVNESLNVNTMDGSMITDFFLKSQIFKTNGVPDYIARNYLRYVVQNDATKITITGGEYNFDIKRLGIKPIDRNVGKFLEFVLRAINKLNNIVNY